MKTTDKKMVEDIYNAAAAAQRQQASMLPLDINHTCWLSTSPPLTTKTTYNTRDGYTDHKIASPVNLSTEATCPACAYIRGYKARQTELHHNQYRHLAEQKADVGL